MSRAPSAAATDLHDLQWLLSMPISRAMLVAAGVICLRHLLHAHGSQLCASIWCDDGPTSKREARRLAGLVRKLEHDLAAFEDIARLQADGVALTDREARARGRAEASRASLARGLALPDTRCFHGAQEDAHGFPFHPGPLTLLRGGKRRPDGGDDGEGGAPLGAA